MREIIIKKNRNQETLIQMREIIIKKNRNQETFTQKWEILNQLNYHNQNNTFFLREPIHGEPYNNLLHSTQQRPLEAQILKNY